MTRTSFIEIHQLVLPNKIDQPYLYLRSFPIRASLFSKYRTIPTLFLANAPCAIGAPTLTKSGNWPSEEKLRRQASPNLKTPTLHCFWATSETVPHPPLRALPTFHPSCRPRSSSPVSRLSINLSPPRRTSLRHLLSPRLPRSGGSLAFHRHRRSALQDRRTSRSDIFSWGSGRDIGLECIVNGRRSSVRSL